MSEVSIEDVRKKLKGQVDILASTENTSEIQSASFKVQGLSVYLSSYDTQELIKLNQQLLESNNKLANATKDLSFYTFILAIATIALVILTYIKQ